MSSAPYRLRRPYGAYDRKSLPQEDIELTHVGPGTPAGEYLRRFWQPVAMSSELGELPLAIRIMGEDLVLFRDLGGRVGLLDRHCSHRGTSLEFGIVTERGISCCYHGWLYDVDGTILETPGEPPQSRLKEKLFHGAYPVHEQGGMIFAYMGPPEEKPDFPVYDATAVPGNRLDPYSLHFACNWLQVHENSMDPVHSVFLHTRASGTQFQEAFGAMPVVRFDKTPIGMIATTTRRWGDHVWVRSSDAILPNLAQFGAFWETGQSEKVMTPAAISRWIVPHDHTSCMTIGWRYSSELVDPEGRTDPNKIGKERVDFMGQTPERSYPERQREPGDYDAQVSQRPIALHRMENLGATDAGVAMLRRLIRRGIRSVKAGDPVPTPQRDAEGVIASYNHDTVLHVSPPSDGDDRDLLTRIGEIAVEIVIESAAQPRDRRAAYVEERLQSTLSRLDPGS